MFLIIWLLQLSTGSHDVLQNSTLTVEGDVVFSYVDEDLTDRAVIHHSDCSSGAGCKQRVDMPAMLISAVKTIRPPSHQKREEISVPTWR